MIKRTIRSTIQTVWKGVKLKVFYIFTLDKVEYIEHLSCVAIVE